MAFCLMCLVEMLEEFADVLIGFFAIGLIEAFM